MPRPLHAALAFASALLLGSVVGVSSRSARAQGDIDLSPLAPAGQQAGARKEPPPDPSRKRAGDTCKSSDECQKHHSCVKVGDQSVCQAPPSRLPPGAVT